MKKGPQKKQLEYQIGIPSKDIRIRIYNDGTYQSSEPMLVSKAIHGKDKGWDTLRVEELDKL